MIGHKFPGGVLAFAVFVGGTSLGLAQGFGPGGFGGGGGFPSPEESFRRIDRNGNDAIDPEEWETVPAPIRRAYEDFADLSRPMDFDDFAELSQQMRERMMSRFRGGGGLEFGRGGGFDRPERGQDEGGENDRRGDERDRGPRRSRGGDRAAGSDEGSTSGSDSSPKKGDKAVEKTAKPKTPLNPKLPEQYRSLDKNRDGQIGLYEWSRTDYAGFRKFDRNGDGFLTPQELLRGPTARLDNSAAGTSGGTSSAAKTGAASAASSGAASSSASNPPLSSGGGSTSRGETAFKLLDKNNDGSISEEEWKKSLTARPTFEKASISVTLPMSRNEFLRMFPQAYPNAK